MSGKNDLIGHNLSVHLPNRVLYRHQIAPRGSRGVAGRVLGQFRSM
jgi:hypothetical protein